VAKEFLSEDKFKKKRQFGDMPKVNKQQTRHGKLEIPNHTPKVKKFAAGGLPAFTSVSSLNEDGTLKDVDTAARLAEFKKWQAAQAAKVAPKVAPMVAPKPAPLPVPPITVTPPGGHSRMPTRFPKPEQGAVRGGGAMGENDQTAKRTPKTRYVPKKFEGARQLRDALTSTKMDSKIAEGMRSPKPPRAGGGWASLREGLKRFNEGVNAASTKGTDGRYAKGGKVRGNGCAIKGKTKGRFC
jgi:hypothetical protein